MAIADITEIQPGTALRGPQCTVCNSLSSLPPDEAVALRSLLSNSAWRYQELSERLADEGLNLGANALSRHARGRCAAGEKLRGSA